MVLPFIVIQDGTLLLRCSIAPLCKKSYSLSSICLAHGKSPDVFAFIQ